MEPKKAFAISIGAHLALGIAMGVSISLSDAKPIAMPVSSVKPVQATFIDSQAIYDKRKAQQEAQARAEQQRRQQEQQARERAEREKRKKAAEEARKKKEQEARERERQQQEQQKREQERREREQRELEKKRQEELEEQLKQEQEAMRAAQQQRVMSEVDKYRSLIYQTIYQNLFIDDSAKGRECELRVKLASNGLVISVDVLGGDESLCIAARAAVLRPETLPVSKDPAVFEEMKSLRIKVKP